MSTAHGAQSAVRLVGHVVLVLASVAAWPASTFAAAADPADPAALHVFSGTDTGSGMCGPYRVSWNNVRSADFTKSGSVTFKVSAPDNQVLVDLSQSLIVGEIVFPLWCGDILGDGSTALAYVDYSGGPHCCFSPSIVLLQPGARHLLDAYLGIGGLTMPAQLDASGPLELLGASDVFAYFDELSFAASPFLPLVYVYVGTQYVEATRQFPDLIKAGIRQGEADLSAAVARTTPDATPADLAYDEQKSVALQLFGLHILLGDADQALPKIKARVAPPVATWLDDNAAEAQASMESHYNLAD